MSSPWSDADDLAEERRLRDDARREKNWKRWGPYLAERQWGTVREDYSARGWERQRKRKRGSKAPGSPLRLRSHLPEPPLADVKLPQEEGFLSLGREVEKKRESFAPASPKMNTVKTQYVVAACLGLAAVVVVLVAYFSRPDILELATRHPPRMWRTENGQKVHPKYRHFEVDAAAEALADVPRPWTVRSMIRFYEGETNYDRRAHALWILAVSEDPRAAVVLGEALDDEALQVRVAATYGLLDLIIRVGVVGGTESHMIAVQRWWAENEDVLRRGRMPFAR